MTSIIEAVTKTIEAVTNFIEAVATTIEAAERDKMYKMTADELAINFKEKPLLIKYCLTNVIMNLKTVEISRID